MLASQKGVLLLSLLEAASASTATVSLGDRTLYSPLATSTPTLTGSAIAIVQNGSPSETSLPSGGIDVFISPDLRLSLKSNMDAKCQKIDDDCYQSLQGILINPKTELHTRQLSVIALGGAVVFGIMSLAIPLYYDTSDHEVPLHIHVPEVQVAQASAAASASVVAVGTGTELPTNLITPNPSPTTIITGAAPSITTQRADANGHKQGDIVFTMNDDLARRVRDLIGQFGTTNCVQVQGSNFRKRDNALAQAICGATGALPNMQPNGPLSDLLIIQPGDFTWLAADLNRAMHEVVAAAQGLALAFRVDSPTAAAIGAGIFAISWLVTTQNNDLIHNAVIPAASLASATATAECTGRAESCKAGCMYVGAIKRCSTTCSTTMACTATSTSKTITTTSVTAWTVDPDYTSPAINPTAAPSVSCGNETPLRGSVHSLTNKFDEFCGRDFSVNQDESWTGNDGIAYELHYKNPGRGYCNANNCKSSLGSAMSACKMQDDLIFKPGSVSIDCGAFSWVFSNSSVAVQGCQPVDGYVSFNRDQANMAVGQFGTWCSIQLQQGKTEGCVFYFNPCAKDFGKKAIGVALTVQQTSWANGKTSDWPLFDEMRDAIQYILTNCGSTGGYRSVSVASGVRMYNITADKSTQYPSPAKIVPNLIGSGGGPKECAEWASA